MADRPEMFGPTRGFSGMVDSMEPCKMLWADPCCHGNEIWASRGDPVAYRLVTFKVSCCFAFLLVEMHAHTHTHIDYIRGHTSNSTNGWRARRRQRYHGGVCC